MATHLCTVTADAHNLITALIGVGGAVNPYRHTVIGAASVELINHDFKGFKSLRSLKGNRRDKR